uniref:Mitotic spindle assembly checkpoint protein MAD2A n=1 Tax=Romanomermis culicivorax TaxID=13658 RepID=A0A915I1T6_ROMCU
MTSPLQQLQMTMSGDMAGSITLSGSAQIVKEFFYYGINNILYQRGVYPAELFRRVQKYGLSLLVTQDPQLEAYFNKLLDHVENLMSKEQCHKLVLVIADVTTKTTLERWQFNIKCDSGASESSNQSQKASNKPLERIQQEIRDVIRQITASVTFLPFLEQQCAIDVLIYAKKDSQVPEGWSDSDPRYVVNGEVVQLKSFSTGLHSVDAKIRLDGNSHNRQMHFIL